jgi:hypothetical protein
MAITDAFTGSGVLDTAIWAQVSTLGMPTRTLNVCDPNSGPSGYLAAIVKASLGIGNDQYAQAKITGWGSAGFATPPASFPGISVRGNITDQSCYLLGCEAFDDGDTVFYNFISLNKLNAAGGLIAISSYAGVGTNGDIVRLEVSGTTLTVKLNGATLGTATDATISTGQPGIRFLRGGSRTSLDDFAADTLAGGGPTTLGPIRDMSQGFNTGFGRGMR